MKQAEPYLMPLRRSTIVVYSPTAKRQGYTATQIDSVMSQYNRQEVPSSSLSEIFSEEEYLAASQRTNAKEGKLSLLAAYYQTKPADFRLYSDLGAMTMVNGNTVDIVGGDDAIVATGYNRDNYDIDNEVDIDEGKWKIKMKAKREDVDAEKIKKKFKVDFEDGEELIMKAYAMNAENPVVLNNVAALYISNGQFKEALPMLQKSIKAEDSQGANYNMGLYYARMGNYPMALNHFNKAKEVKGIEYNRAVAKIMTGDYQGAKEDIRKFTKANPDHMLGHYVAAIVGARMDDLTMLTVNLRKAIDLSENKNLADASAEDLEFVKYWDNPEFKDASDDD
jgi:tetratricopeptide (TPR) repeat protein